MIVKSIESILIALVALFAPTKGVVITVMALSMIDLMTGLAASKKRKKKITSNGLKKTVVKVVVYEIAVLTAFLVGTFLTGEEFPVMKLLTSLIGVVEFKSILENLDIIAGGSFFRSMRGKLQDFISSDNKE